MLNAVIAELSDERLGTKLRVTENRCVLFNSLTNVYYIYIYIYISVFLTSLKLLVLTVSYKEKCETFAFQKYKVIQ